MTAWIINFTKIFGVLSFISSIGSSPLYIWSNYLWREIDSQITWCTFYSNGKLGFLYLADSVVTGLYVTAQYQNQEINTGQGTAWLLVPSSRINFTVTKITDKMGSYHTFHSLLKLLKLTALYLNISFLCFFFSDRVSIKKTKTIALIAQSGMAYTLIFLLCCQTKRSIIHCHYYDYSELIRYCSDGLCESQKKWNLLPLAVLWNLN